MTQPIIELQALTHRYGHFTAIKELTLSVERGEIFGFLGPNGAGKTTTIRTLLDFIRPNEGAARLFGLDSVRDSLAIRTRIGYLPSELKLWENWTGEQYIQWLETVRGGVSLLPEGQRLAERLDYDLQRPLSGMSTGMKRKMGLIAAFVHQPDLLILDEPTTGLDPLMQQVFYDLMLEVKAQGRTAFVSSHILPEVEHICDRVGIIRQGELKAVERVDKLTHVAFRWLTLEMNGLASVDSFAQLDGVSEVSADGSALRMRMSGAASMDAVIKLAAQHSIKDIKIEQPSLEEIFLSYYNHQC
jgi:ABC-2 type transport system ATP-binding protein